MTKQELINIAIEKPLSFDDKLFRELVNKKDPEGTPEADKKEELAFPDIREMLKHIYDMNETGLQKASDASVGTLGKLNKGDTEQRLEEFNHRIRKIFETEKNKKSDRKKQRIILAEGDSWFMFPWFVTDIIDWLNIFFKDEFAIYSIAYGGDWVTNIVYEGKYVEELSTLKPEYFLISGGGNDLVGSNKLAVMVDDECGIKQYPDSYEHKGNNGNGYGKAEKYITREFYAFINTLKLQYYLMFRSIHASKKLSETKIITQGYDYAIPSFERHWSKNPFQWFVNYFVDTGKWLMRPLCIKNIPHEFHKEIVKLMIDKVNEMFIELAEMKADDGSEQFPRLYHIDCRGVATAPTDWFDELHLKSAVFKKVATAYRKFINHETAAGSKVIKATEIIKQN